MSGPDSPARLLLVDDEPLVRAGIGAILGTAGDLQIVAEAGDGHEALAVVQARRVDLVLLDIQMPRLDGPATLSALGQRHPALPVAMLTTFSDEDRVAEAVALGARGFLLKSDDPRALVDAVRGVLAGGAAFSPGVARWLVRDEARTRSDLALGARRQVDGLAAQQVELLRQLATGRSNAEIAGAMLLAEGTVKQYLRQLYLDLGVTSRVQAAILAHRAGLADDVGTR